MPGRKSWICGLLFRSFEALGNVRGFIIIYMILKSPLQLFVVPISDFHLKRLDLVALHVHRKCGAMIIL